LVHIDANAEQGSSRSDLFFSLFQGAPLEGCERSIKLCERTLLANRYLCGISTAAIPDKNLFDLCRKMEMPEDYLYALKERLPDADILHFGFEESESGFIYKVYVEYAIRYYAALASNVRDVDKVLVHVAYKWDVLNRKKRTIARYQAYPGMSISELLSRLEAIYTDNPCSRSFAAAKDIITLAAGRSATTPMYLAVSEEGNPRSSFDINLHHANLLLCDIEPQVRLLCEYFSISLEKMQRWFAQVSGEKLGHLSGGISRNGSEFLTIYYENDEWTRGGMYAPNPKQN